MHTFAALRQPNFRIYFSGQFISITGTWMQRIAQGWLMFHLTGSALWLGLQAFAIGLPALLLAPWAGVLADRYPRRVILMVGYTAEMTVALVLAALTLSDAITPVALLMCSVLLGLTSAVNEPNRQAFVPDVVEPQDLDSGLALNAIMVTSGMMFGPTLAGILLETIGAGGCFAVNGLSFVAVIGSLALVTTHPSARQRAHPWRQLVDGVRFARFHTTIGPLLLLQAMGAVLGTNMVHTLMPAIADTVFHSPVRGYAALSTAMGAGSLLGSFVTVSIGRRIRAGRLVSILAVGMPLLVMAFGLMRDLRVAVLMTGLMGFGYTLYFVTSMILLQSTVPNDFRGRVVALWSMNRFGLAPVGALGIGVLAAHLGVALTVVGLSAGLAGASTWVVRRSRGLVGAA